MPLVPIENTVQHRISDHQAAVTLPHYTGTQPSIISTHSLAPQTVLTADSSSSRVHRSSTQASQASGSDATNTDTPPSRHGQGVPPTRRTSATSLMEQDDEEMRGDPEAGESDMDVDRRGGWPNEDEEEGDTDAYIPSDAGDDTGADAGVEVDEEELEVDNGGDERIVFRSDEERERKNRHHDTKKSKKAQPKALDYNEDVEALLNHASGLMRSLVVSENPMPSVDESIELAGDAYHLAKSDRPHVNPPAHIKHVSIVRTRFYSPIVHSPLFQLRWAIPQVWGKIKDAAQARTSDTYSFDDRPRMGQKNR